MERLTRNPSSSLVSTASFAILAALNISAFDPSFVRAEPVVSVIDLSSEAQLPADLAERSDGVIVVGAQTMDALPIDRSGLLAFVQPDLADYVLTRTGKINPVETTSVAIDPNGQWFGTKDQNATAGVGETARPDSVTDIGFISTPLTLIYAIDAQGTVYGVTGGGTGSIFVPLGGSMQIMPGAVSGPITDTTVSGSLQVGLGGEPQFGNLYPVLRTKTEFRGWLPRDADETTTFTNPAISPNGDLITASRVKLSLNPSTFEVVAHQNPVYYRRSSGVAEVDAHASDYTRFVVSYADGSPFTGEATSVTDLVHGWIGGNTLGDDNPQAWIMNIHTMSEPILVRDWMQSEYGVTLPRIPTHVRDLLIASDGSLVLLLDGSAMVVKVDFDGSAGDEDLEILGTDGNDNVKVTIEDSGVTATVNGVSNSYPLPTGTIAVNLGGGKNKLKLKVKTADRTVRVTDGDGASTIDMRLVGAKNCLAEVALGGGADKFDLLARKKSDHCQVYVKGGADTAKKKLNYVIENSSSVAVYGRSGNGADDVGLAALNAPDLDFALDLQGGNDSFAAAVLQANRARVLVDGAAGKDHFAYLVADSDDVQTGISAGSDSEKNEIHGTVTLAKNSRDVLVSGAGRNKFSLYYLLSPQSQGHIYTSSASSVSSAVLLSPRAKIKRVNAQPPAADNPAALVGQILSQSGFFN